MIDMTDDVIVVKLFNEVGDLNGIGSMSRMVT